MPYINGQRVSQAEYARAKRLAEGRDPDEEQFLHTGPRGENPAKAPDIDETTGAPVSKSKKKAGSERSKRTTATVKAAVADALGIKTDSPALADIDASALDDDSDTDKESE